MSSEGLASATKRKKEIKQEGETGRLSSFLLLHELVDTLSDFLSKLWILQSFEHRKRKLLRLKMSQGHGLFLNLEDIYQFKITSKK